ncbi:MAG: 2-C-methyl-D-erythritol 4-phosphate cytidylyltransferase [Candidatus Omnitrophica bacterium]|jgi:2-C-methyl-D-erythritol 4-phosphate cytidylyltransferase|nr:2-C-methyl-D-erythritol 4-phosphate cytidylyltransferase [Candidatus Omnitrophota bacterium]MDD5079667.1 2-C-methyl-D-erythritol 4-phosphate cytidylyltransferase [Candidatus Omnitrophota bacterium]
MKMYVTAIVLAAGKGLRFGSAKPKQLSLLGGKPVIIHSLLALSGSEHIRDIVLVVNSTNKGDILGQVRKYNIPKIRQVVFGGKRRQDSVRNALKVLDKSAELVLIHDGVRPFIGKDYIDGLIREAAKTKAAILAVPVKATVKKARKSGRGKSLRVSQSLKREELWEVQTPQAFNKELLVTAYDRFNSGDVTDDAMLIEKMAKPVSLVMGSYENIKITTPEDLAIAEVFYKQKRF